jgi:O-6-methylguanine DNA methyltransferase
VEIAPHGSKPDPWATHVVGEESPLVQQHTELAIQQIQEYLKGERRAFTLPIDWRGLTPFQIRSLQAAVEIPYGETATYSDIARWIGAPRAARAVGRAMATNPVPLVLPCHRVVGKDGGLNGYRAPGGVKTKAWLLNLEKFNPQDTP